MRLRHGFYSDPFNTPSVDHFARQMHSLLRAFQDAQDTPGVRAPDGAFPPTNVYSRGESYLLELRVPGLKEDEVKLHFLDGALTVRGEAAADAPEGYASHRRERRPVRFARTFNFNTPIDAERITARLSDGLLTVELPRSPEAQPRTIPVLAG